MEAINDKPECTHQTVDYAKAMARKTELKNLHIDGEHKLDTKLESELYMCITEQLCGAVSIEIRPIEDDKDGNKQFDSIVCQHYYQVVPVLDAAKKAWFFTKNPVAIKDDMEESNTEESKFYYDALKSLTPQEGMVKIQRMQEKKCMCDEPLGDFRKRGCRTYQDVYGVDHAWCWVRMDNEVFEACEEKGIKMFYDQKSKKVWTEDICEKAACKCSGIGMYPIDPNDPDIDDTILDPNKLNYGGMCRRWRKSDRQRWCYTGYDSACPDRSKKSAHWGPANGIQQQWMQYEAKLPCDKEEQEELVEVASSWCKNISIPTEILLVISFVWYLPMVVILFKFLSNRCGDEFEVTGTFDIVLSSDEDEEEEEWNEEAGKECKEDKKDKSDDDESEDAKPVT